MVYLFHEYLASNKNGQMIAIATWKIPKGIMLTERSRLKRLHTIRFHWYDILEKDKTTKDGEQISGCQKMGI